MLACPHFFHHLTIVKISNFDVPFEVINKSKTSVRLSNKINEKLNHSIPSETTSSISDP